MNSVKLYRFSGSVLAIILAQQLLVSTCDGQTNLAVPIGPRAILTNGPPTYFRFRSSSPASPTETPLGASPTEATNFIAVNSYDDQDLNGLRWLPPPDSMGAVGTNFLVIMVNTEVRIQTRGGGLIKRASLGEFWTSTNIPSFQGPNDSRVVYDPFNDRWIATCMTDYPTTNSSILIGVSRTGNPTNFSDVGWNLRQIRSDPGNLSTADFPSIGFNRDWIVVHANLLGLHSNDPVLRSFFWVFNKTNLYSGAYTSPTFLSYTNTELAGNITPAAMYDNSISTFYLLQNANGNTNENGYIRLFTITGAIGSETLNYVTNAIYIPLTNTWANAFTNDEAFMQNYAYCCGAQPGTPLRIGTVEDARIGNVVYRNGSLWATHTVFLPTNNVMIRRSLIQWFQIEPSTASLIQYGRIDDPVGGTQYAFASIGVNRFNDVLIGYNLFSTNYFASAGYSFRNFFDPPNKLRDPWIFHYGEDVFYDHRWGDYSATVTDPVNDTDLWTIQEYATIHLGETNEEIGLWSTRWAQVTLPVPTNDNFSSAQVISGTQGATNGTSIRGTKEGGEPNHAGSTNTASVWYSWTAPTNGYVFIETATNSFDTVLAVYTGNTVGALTLVTNNHGGVGAGASRVVFNAANGTNYRVAVDGFALRPGNQGTFALTWHRPVAPEMSIQPQSHTNTVGDNVTFSAVAVGIPDPWYQWKFNATNTISGATNSSYAKLNVQTNDMGSYTVVCTNLSGSVTSQVAYLQVYETSASDLTTAAITNGNQMKFYVSANTNLIYVIDVSSNLVSWVPIKTNNAPFLYLDPQTITNYPQRFYRARYQP